MRDACSLAGDDITESAVIRHSDEVVASLSSFLIMANAPIFWDLIGAGVELGREGCGMNEGFVKRWGRGLVSNFRPSVQFPE